MTRPSLTLAEFAAHTGLSKRQIRSLVKRGYIAPLEGGVYLTEEIDRLMSRLKEERDARLQSLRAQSSSSQVGEVGVPGDPSGLAEVLLRVD